MQRIKYFAFFIFLGNFSQAGALFDGEIDVPQTVISIPELKEVYPIWDAPFPENQFKLDQLDLSYSVMCVGESKSTASYLPPKMF